MGSDTSSNPRLIVRIERRHVGVLAQVDCGKVLQKDVELSLQRNHPYGAAMPSVTAEFSNRVVSEGLVIIVANVVAVPISDAVDWATRWAVQQRDDMLKRSLWLPRAFLPKQLRLLHLRQFQCRVPLDGCPFLPSTFYLRRSGIR